MKRWFFFFFLVAIIAAVAALGGFTDSTGPETVWPVGFGKVMFLSVLGLAAAAFVGWLAFLSQKRNERRPPAPPPPRSSMPPALRDTVPHTGSGDEEFRAGR